MAKITQTQTNDARIWLGVSKKTINPKPGLRLFGFPAERPNTGVESDLFVRTVVFGSGEDHPEAVLSVIDNLYAPSTIVAAVREKVAKRHPGLKPSAIMVAASHTHSAPNLITYQSTNKGEGRVQPDTSYKNLVIENIVNSITEAWNNRRRVTARYGAGQADLGHNRRAIYGQYARNEWQDPQRKHTGYFNPEIPFTTFHDEKNRVYAIIAGYGCHPVTLGPSNLKVSADYPGYFVNALEKQTGAELAIQIMTGAADINPLRCLSNSPRQAKLIGKALAQAVSEMIPQSKPVKLSAVSSRTESVSFRLRDNIGRGPIDILKERGAGEFLQTEVQSIDLGDINFISAPGELFSEIATRVRESSPAKYTFVVEHANDAIGYIFTDEAALQGGYEVCRASISESMERHYLAAVKNVISPLRK